jgi:hypothetical protein
MLPVLIVSLVLSLAIGARVAADGGNLTGLVQFGSTFAPTIHPPSGAAITSSDGYDGQFFYAQARDPLLLHDATVNALRDAGAGFRMQRVAYPALVDLLALGQPGAIPLMLLVANVLVLLGFAAGFAVYARHRAWSPLWAVPIALMPGMLLSVLRDLSDPLALASVVAGLLLWRAGRRWPAALALSVAVLTREVMMLAVVAVAAETAASAWRGRAGAGGWRTMAARAWPVVAIPTLAFGGWQAYIMARYGGPVGGADLGLPLVNLIEEVRGDLHWPVTTALWDAAYVLLIVIAAGAALRSLTRRVTITSAAACALALGVLVPTLGDPWSDSRLSAPLFALVLIDGLDTGRRFPVVVSALAAALSILIPVAIPGTF